MSNWNGECSTNALAALHGLIALLLQRDFIHILGLKDNVNGATVVAPRAKRDFLFSTCGFKGSSIAAVFRDEDFIHPIDFAASVNPGQIFHFGIRCETQRLVHGDPGVLRCGRQDMHHGPAAVQAACGDGQRDLEPVCGDFRRAPEPRLFHALLANSLRP